MVNKLKNWNWRRTWNVPEFFTEAKLIFIFWIYIKWIQNFLTCLHREKKFNLNWSNFARLNFILWQTLIWKQKYWNGFITTANQMSRSELLIIEKKTSSFLGGQIFELSLHWTISNLRKKLNKIFLSWETNLRLRGEY